MNLHFPIAAPSAVDDARCKIASAEQLVEEQKQRIDALKSKHLPANEAELLLKRMLDTLSLFRRTLAVLEAEAAYAEIRAAVARAMQGSGVICPESEAARLARAYPDCGMAQPELARAVRRLALAKHVGIGTMLRPS